MLNWFINRFARINSDNYHFQMAEILQYLQTV